MRRCSSATRAATISSARASRSTSPGPSTPACSSSTRATSSWAKLCFEYSPQREPMVVSVVTRGLSDDCNSFVVDGATVWLRIARVGSAFAFHASTDGAVELHPPLRARGRPRAVGRVRRSVAERRRVCSYVRADRLRGHTPRGSAQRRVAPATRRALGTGPARPCAGPPSSPRRSAGPSSRTS